MKILVTGDRNWVDKDSVMWTFLGIYVDLNHNDVTIIEGGARGADTLAKKAALSLGWKVKEEKADWKQYGKAAGPIRNQKMLDMGPDLVIAFHNDLENSKGTKDMVNRAKKKGVKVTVISDKI